MIEIDERIAWEASRIARELRGAGSPIGDNGIWIAASAVAFGLPLVTRNIRHFGRVRALQVVGY